MSYEKIDDVIRDLTQMREWIEDHEQSISRQYLCAKIHKLTDLIQAVLSDHRTRIDKLEERMDNASSAFADLKSKLENGS